jgi:hypothetical protein
MDSLHPGRTPGITFAERVNLTMEPIMEFQLLEQGADEMDEMKRGLVHSAKVRRRIRFEKKLQPVKSR